MQPNKIEVYTFLCSIFTVLLVTGNLIYQKFVYLPLLPFYSFELSVGVICYPLTFLITDLITEFYGKTYANFCVKMAIIISIFIALLITGVGKLQATEWSKVDNETFNLVFGAYGLAFLFSIIATFTSQSIDILLYLLIRRLTKGKLLWLRSNVSTCISLLIDTCIVIGLLGFFEVIPRAQTASLIFNSYLFKVLVTVLSTPVFYAAVYCIKSLGIRSINSDFNTNPQELNRAN